MKRLSKIILLALTLLSVCNAVNAQSIPEIHAGDLKIKVGGALRFNYRYKDWDDHSKNQGGGLLFDMFRVETGIKWKKWEMFAQSRFYARSSGGYILKEGWMAYNFNENNQLRFGQTRVPFGLLPYQSNSYFFNINYFIGLEDDDDFGLTYQYKNDHWDIMTSFFKNSDLLNGESSKASYDRYSYDITGDNKETNTGAVRVEYKGGNEFKYKLGVSGLGGQLYNLEKKESAFRYAYAAHAQLNYKNWELKAQYTGYDYDHEANTTDGTIEMAAFGDAYKVAAAGQGVSACLAYTFKFNKPWLTSIQIYNDFSYLHKTHEGFNDSFENDLGAGITAGPVFMWFDIASGKNHPWLGPNWNGGFAEGDDTGWHTRVNLNVGYYF